MSKHKKRRIGLFVLALLALIGLLANSIAEKIITESLSEFLNDLNRSTEYNFKIDEVDANIYTGTISVFGFKASPDEDLFTDLKSGALQEEVLNQITVTRASVSGLSALRLLIHKHLTIDEITLEKLIFNSYRPIRAYQVESVEADKRSKLAVDTLFFPGLREIDLNSMRIADLRVHVLDISENDTISSYKGHEVLLSGMGIKTLDANNSLFAFNNSRLEVRLEKQEFQLPEGFYEVTFDHLHYWYNLQKMELANFRYTPVKEPSEFAANSDQVYNIYTLNADSIFVAGIDTRSVFRSGVFDIDKIDILGMNVSMFKDKTRPYDESVVTLLPHMALEKLGQPLHIDSIAIRGSSFLYTEKNSDKEELLKVNIDKIEGKFSFITSIQDSLEAGRSLEGQLDATVLDVLPASITLKMPYKKAGYPFYMSGFTKGTTEVEDLNTTIYRAMGMKFKNGRLDAINFNITADPEVAKGELSMLYTDLEVEFFKEDDSENKKVSFLANAFIRASNPGKNGKTTVSKVNFKRLKYKGFGNYLWLSIRSGIINSIIPFGKRKRQKEKGD